MRRRCIPLGLATLLLLGAVPAVQAAPPNSFTGAWTSTDPVDGSTQYATVSGGDVVKITYTDLYASVCVNSGAATTVFSSIIVGTASGDTIEGAFASARCGSLYFDTLVGSPVTLYYDSATDTILAGSVTWYRL
jgi:hypothetical protein